MNIKSWNVLLVLSLLIVLSGGGYILYQNDLQKKAGLVQQETEVSEEAETQPMPEFEAAVDEEPALAQRFEDFLNGFLQKVAQDVIEYKQARNVLKDLVEPQNLLEPEYVHENARLAESTVMSLQLQMDDIMKRFEDADQKAQTLIHEFDTEGQEIVQQEWVQTRDENAQKFMAFFTMDQDILMAYLNLMEFYDTHREVLQVDVVNRHVTFEDIALEEKEALLRGRIIELRTMQQDVLREQTKDQQGG